ncbi:hypothetical protein LTR09_003791 [Extremus antarcticus]|uniref:Uncharacterized protein n=1 Tax=Extremus antarcticus TaxID=702011 RepID=A0AAJ0DJM8_9PEZI|nr:hypothetical protein LTR09_003791 [Extremus antarcticus]
MSNQQGSRQPTEAWYPPDRLRRNSTSSARSNDTTIEWSQPSSNARRSPMDPMYPITHRPEPSNARLTGTDEILPTQRVKGIKLLSLPPKKSRPRDSARQIEGMKTFFDYRTFNRTLDAEIEELNNMNFGPRTDTDLRLLLAHAVKTVLEAIRAHKNMLVKGGVRRDLVEHDINIEYFDLDDLTGRQDVMLRKYFEGEDLRYFDVNERTLPTIAMLGILKTRIQYFPPQPKMLPEAKRYEMLRNWIDNWARRETEDHPLKLYQPHFKKRDINYAAFYAKYRYNEALMSYRNLWRYYEQKGAIKHAVREWGCPHPDDLVERQANTLPDFLLDLNTLDDSEIMDFNWDRLPIVFPRLADPITLRQERRCRHFRHSIAKFARDTRFVEAWIMDLQYAYDDYQERKARRERERRRATED